MIYNKIIMKKFSIRLYLSFYFFLSMEAFDRSQSLLGFEVDHKSFITPIVHIF